MGEEYVIAEVKFCILSTSLVLVVNHMATRPGLFEEKKNESFFPLNFNVDINLDNRERAKATKKNSNGDQSCWKKNMKII